MLVIGFVDGENLVYYRNLEVDPDSDTAQKIHNSLKKSVKEEDLEFSYILCVENDEVLAKFNYGDDYADDNSEGEDTDLDDVLRELDDVDE